MLLFIEINIRWKNYKLLKLNVKIIQYKNKIFNIKNKSQYKILKNTVI